MKILIFLPSSNFAIDIISKALFLKENGYQVFFLSTSPKSKIHEYLEEKQIKCLSLNLNKLSSNNYLSAAFFLHKFVLKNKIDCIISNNLQGNFISVLSQFIHRKRTLLIRHHSDYIFHGKNKNAKRQQWFVNRFGKEFIAISDKVKDQMLVEGISPNKIHRINLGFDFTLFPKADQDHVEALKVELSNSLRLISIARLIPLKRHLLLFQSIKNLADKGLNVILWVVGEGPLKSELVDWVRSNQLEEVILFTGYIENTQDYLSASDLLINISESEASSHVVREASIYETPVLVCNEVGDFADYIVDDYNGYLIDKDSSAESLTNKIEEITGDKELVLKSDRLKKNVLARFDILINGKTLLKLILDNSQKKNQAYNFNFHIIMASKVSIIIPIFNADAFIKKTIESVLTQSHKDFEIICIDDGSTDKSAEIIHTFQDPRISYFYYPNSGVSAARNKGFEKVNSDYVVFLDADDCLSMSFLEKRIEALTSDIEIGVCSDIELIDEEDNKIEDSNSYEGITSTFQILQASPYLISCPSAYLFNYIKLKKSKVRFNEKLNSSADKFFLLEVLSNYKIKFIPSSPLYYRIVSNSMSHQLNIAAINDKLSFLFQLKIHFGKSMDIKNSTYSRLNYSIAGMAFHIRKRELFIKHLFKSFILSPFTFFSLLFK